MKDTKHPVKYVAYCVHKNSIKKISLEKEMKLCIK